MTDDFDTYDQAMDLIREQTTALKVCRAVLKGCQAENEKLIQGMRYYAEADWRTAAMMDRGEHARRILGEVMGNGKSGEV